jgi:putative ABC transport system permease protein
MRTWLADLQFALRQLRKAPGFALLAVLTLAFGIGANTAMFTVIESVLLRPLPYSGASRLVAIGASGSNGLESTSWLNYLDIRNGLQNVATVAGYSNDFAIVENQGNSLSVTGPRITPNLLEMLGVKPLLGRTFTAEEGLRGGAQVAMLSEGLWRGDFHADPNIIGQRVKIGGESRTIVGVLPGNFRFPEQDGSQMATAVWLPLQPTPEMLKDRGYDFFEIVAKIHPGVRLAQAQTQLAIVNREMGKRDSEDSPQRFTLVSYAQFVTGNLRPVFLSLASALGLVLLIACANVANLLLARAIGRQQEFAVRSALGAGRWRLLRQVMTEGAMLSVLGSAAGLGLAGLAIAAIHHLPPDTFARMNAVHVRWTVILALASIATLTTVLSSLLPALLVSGADLQPALQAASRGLGSRSVRGKITTWLVSAEIALSTLLLVATGLLARTMWNLEHAWLGFHVNQLTAFQATPPSATGFSSMGVSPQGSVQPVSVDVVDYQPVLEQLRHTPGIEDATMSTLLPLYGSNVRTSFQIVGHKVPEQNAPQARITAVSSDYARVLGTPLLRGRMITSDDTASSQPVVVINEALAKKCFAGRDPLGQQLDLGGKDTGILVPPTIVGVIADERDISIKSPPGPLILLAAAQIPTSSLFYEALLNTQVTFLVRTRGNVPVTEEIRSVFRQTAPGFALDNFQTMKQVVDQTTFNQKLGLDLTASFAGLAVLMVIAGLYGVLAQLVGFRRREIGLRLALGATRGAVVNMIFRQSLLLAAYGLAAGLGVSLIIGRLLRSFLYGVNSFDPTTYAGVLLLLLLVSLLAALSPARQAAAVDPMKMLRME